MKTKLFILFLASGLSTLAYRGEAADSPIYVRGSFGEAQLSSDFGFFENARTSRYELGLGWALTDWASVEVVRFDYEVLDNLWPPPSNDPAENTIPPLSQEFDFGGYGISAVFSYSINANFSVFTRQGIGFTEYQYRPDPNDTREWIYANPQDKETTKYRGSIGAMFYLPAFNSTSLSIELIREQGYDITAESVNAGFTYQF